MAFDPESSGRGRSAGPGVVLLRNAPIDIHAAGVHAFRPDAARDNLYDYNAILALPAGLGLTVAIDGTNATITTTTAGIWAYELKLNCQGQTDLTFAGVLTCTLDVAVLNIGPAINANDANALTYSGVVALPAGATGQMQVVTSVPATTNPLDVALLATFTRLG